MAKEKMKKYRIALGICGPTVMYSKIIKAYSEEEAVKKYLADSGEECTDDKVKNLIRFTREKVSVKDDDPSLGTMYDFELNVLQVGDRVAFICNQPNDEGFRRYSVQEGVISKISDSSAEIYSEVLDKTFRVMKTSGAYIGNDVSDYRLKKVAKLMNHYEPEENSLNDSLGQGVHEGDTIVYMADIYQDSCEGFIKGIVQKESATMVFVENGKRKTSPKFAVVQRNS